MFTPSAHLYDLIFQARGKDYQREAESVHQSIREHLRADGNTLLDVACGTGTHTHYLSAYYRVEGLDLDERMLDAARVKYPDIPFHQGDMLTFDLGRQFDAITCLFSSIAYVRTLDAMRQTIANFKRHLKPGGVMVVEPWFTPDDWFPGDIYATFVDEPYLKIARMNTTGCEGNLSYFVFHYMVGTPEGIETFSERHELGLFTVEEYLDAFRVCHLDVIRDPLWLNGRGLYIATRPLEDV